jgi:hypothetical protein
LEIRGGAWRYERLFGRRMRFAVGPALRQDYHALPPSQATSQIHGKTSSMTSLPAKAKDPSPKDQNEAPQICPSASRAIVGVRRKGRPVGAKTKKAYPKEDPSPNLKDKDEVPQICPSALALTPSPTR